jgi:hypothetical protein
MIVMNMPSLLRRFAGTVGIVVLASLGVYARSEVDPDHLDSPTTEPIPQPKLPPTPPSSETRYNGKFTLPYAVQCNGRSLLPGRYSFSFRSDETLGPGALKWKDRTLEIAGIVRQKARKTGHDALIVENRRSARTLSLDPTGGF